MSQINRLSGSHGIYHARIDSSKPITFIFNNKSYTGYLGDTVASALLANGVKVVGRSFKYGRPRGIIAAGAEEPNAILQLGKTEETQVPNVRATQQLIFEGLVCHSTNGWPSADRDLMGVMGKVFGRFLPPGFYYKTFMAPRALWMSYEKLIRKGAGLGRSPLKPDPDVYDVIFWISPDEVLLLVPEKTEFEVETKLRELMTGHIAIVNVTGGQTVLELSGARAENILKKSSSYDIHSSNFPIGKVVTTVFAKSQLVLRRTGDNSFQLIIRRSFSDYIWKWIVDAGSRK